MAIYKQNLPYTYLIGWSSLNTWYYGRRTGQSCHPSEFWVKYFTSSVEVDKFRCKHGEPDVIQIRKIFNKKDNIRNCIKHEVTVIRRIKAVQKSNWLNKGNAGTEFDTSGKVIAKNLKTGQTVMVDLAEFAIAPSFVGINSGIQFKKIECLWCNKEIPINNLTNHTTFCLQNPNKIVHHRTGIPLSEEIKEKMIRNHHNVSGENNPKAKFWKLISPLGDITHIHGTLNQVLIDKELSRAQLIANLGKVVVYSSYLRSEKARNTVGWKLQLND